MGALQHIVIGRLHQARFHHADGLFFICVKECKEHIGVRHFEVVCGIVHLILTLGPEPWNVAYIEPCRRPADGRYGENPSDHAHFTDAAPERPSSKRRIGLAPSPTRLYLVQITILLTWLILSHVAVLLTAVMEKIQTVCSIIINIR